MTPTELYQNNQNLVYYIYNKSFARFPQNDLYKEDIIQDGMTALWMACMSFDESKGIQPTTYIYPWVYFRMLHRAIYYTKHQSEMVSLQSVMMTNEEGELTLEDLLMSNNQFEDEICVRYCIDMCCKDMSPKERQIMELLAQGYTQTQVSNRIGISQAQISRILNKLRRKLTEELQE